MRAVVRGGKTFPQPQTTAARAVMPAQLNELQHRAGSPPTTQAESIAQTPNYARELRAVGQELEKRGFTKFNLKCSGDAYFVWSTEDCSRIGANSAAIHATRARDANPPQADTKVLLDRIAGVLFNATDVKRLELAGIAERRQKIAASNGRRLSHLLRTVGEQVYRRNQRLLALAWQDGQISVVIENPRGRREINVLRTDNLYDLWVRMYLRRSH
jgi:hypothetical protein